MRQKKNLVALTLAVGLGVVSSSGEARAQDRPRRGWCWGCCLHRSDRDWAAEAAALGVVGGAPALGFCGAVNGYETGVLHAPFPFPPHQTEGTTPEPPTANVPPQPSAAGTRALEGGPVLGGPPTQPGPAGILTTPMVPAPAPRPGLSPLPTTTTTPSGRTVGPSPGSP